METVFAEEQRRRIGVWSVLEASAARIQAGWRGRLARREAAALRQKLTEREKWGRFADVTLDRCVRKAIKREKVRQAAEEKAATERRAATKIQALYRGFRSRLHENQDMAATRVQRSSTKGGT
jgi:hypothetical protein